MPPPREAEDDGYRVFEALKAVMLDGSDVVDEVKQTHQMRDLPVLDISRSLLSGSSKHAVVSTSLQNLAAYAQHCHPGPYGDHVVEGAYYDTRAACADDSQPSQPSSLGSPAH